jgi:hypothetical protein
MATQLTRARRLAVQCLFRWTQVLDPSVKKGLWTESEDQLLSDLVAKYGAGKVCVRLGHFRLPLVRIYRSGRPPSRPAVVLRCLHDVHWPHWKAVPRTVRAASRSSRVTTLILTWLTALRVPRWHNYLMPNLRRGPWGPEEDAIVLKVQQMRHASCSSLARAALTLSLALPRAFLSAPRRAWEPVGPDCARSPRPLVGCRQEPLVQLPSGAPRGPPAVITAAPTVCASPHSSKLRPRKTSSNSSSNTNNRSSRPRPPRLRLSSRWAGSRRRQPQAASEADQRRLPRGPRPR